MSDNTGGPAFPDWPESAFPSTFQSMSPEPHQVHRWGMTLRDYFAAKAMQGLLSNPKLQEQILKNGQSWIEESAYGWADGMLKARQE